MAEKKPDELNIPESIESPRRRSLASILLTSSSPPAFTSFDELMKASTCVANMALAHEIAIDADFKLQKYDVFSKSSIEGRIRETMVAAFWDILRTELQSSPPEYKQALSLLEEVREEIKGLLLPKQDRLRKQIDEALDLTLIQQQLENDAFDLRNYADFIVDMMSKLCAEVRDNDISNLRQITDPIELYKEIFRVLDLMKMDMANFTIYQMRPYIQQQSVYYEKKKFQEYLDTQSKINIDGLAVTKDWLKSVYVKCTNTENRQENSNISPSILLCKAYLELLNWDVSKEFPECCAMDQTRFLTIGEVFRRCILVSSLVLNTTSFFSIAVNQNELKNTLKDHCLAIIADIPSGRFVEKSQCLSEQIINDVKEHTRKYEIMIDDSKNADMHKLLIQAVDPDHRVQKLLDSRLTEFLLNTLLSTHREPLQIPQGLSLVQQEIVQISGQLMRIVAHNRNVFGTYYDDIIQNIITIV